MDAFALIPARGGSKGIERKNLRRVGGLSLLARAVRACRQAHGVKAVWVSSDDSQILEEAARSGAQTLLRPAAISGDLATSESALAHALEAWDGQGAAPQTLVMVQCTSPFVTADDIDGTLEAMMREGADCALTVTPFHGFLWTQGAAESGIAAVGHDAAHRPRRQDRDPVYRETGGVYAMTTEGFREHRHRFFGKIAHHVVDEGRAIEIDTLQELELANWQARNEALSPGLMAQLAAVDTLLLDFDGVMTDNRAIVSQNGDEAVVVSRSDGFGIELISRLGIETVVISKERNDVVAARCRKLGIACYQAIDDKAGALERWSRETGRALGACLFMGNDINDLPAFEKVALSAAPCDGEAPVVSAADIVVPRRGGDGAVRWLCDQMVASRKTTGSPCG